MTGALTVVTGDLTVVTGDLTVVTGDLTAVTVALTAVTRDQTAVTRDLTSVTVDLTSVTGDLTAVTCDPTAAERWSAVAVSARPASRRSSRSSRVEPERREMISTPPPVTGRPPQRLGHHLSRTRQTERDGHGSVVDDLNSGYVTIDGQTQT